MVKIIKYPQSCFLLDFDGTTVLLDPGIHMREKNFDAKKLPEVNIMLITHKHSDHFDQGLVKQILYRDGSAIITNTEVQQLLKETGLECETIEFGDTMVTEVVTIKAHQSVPGQHPQHGGKKPVVTGFAISKDGQSVYHPGDSKIPESIPKANVALVPISGTVTMNPDEGVEFAKKIGADVAIPMHYDSQEFPMDSDALSQASAGAVNVKVLENGESFDF